MSSVQNKSSKSEPHFEDNQDYPDYKTNPVNVSIRANHILVGIILTTLFSFAAVITMLIDFMVGQDISWSLIVLASTTLGWICIAYPFFRKRSTFFRLFSIDSFAVAVYLMVLNFIISQNFVWAVYPTLGLLMMWIILAGFFRTKRISKKIPIVLYYVISFLILFVITYS